MLPASIRKNDLLAKALIYTVSFVIFAAIVLLSRIKVEVQSGFDIHVFAKINAFINSIVAFLLLVGLFAVQQGKYRLHKKVMLTAIFLSVIFLISYICHHLLSGDTKYGGVGFTRYIYFFILITHIFLAGIILPFILFTSYRALIAEWPAHRRIAKITWPVWLYVSITGVVVYWMISPYYT